MAQVHLPLAPRRGFAETNRKDKWWVYPLVVFVGLGGLIGYATWAGMQNAHYTFGSYLSPLYSPVLWGEAKFAWIAPGEPGFWPSILPYSPAALILIFPAGFRVTCYYYRGAYYKGFWLSPPNCAVGKPHKTYAGERAFPLVLQNLHRYFMYAAVLYLFILAHDTYLGMWFTNEAGAYEFGIGVGTIVLALNVTFLSLYTFGCHSFRHTFGGFTNRLSKSPVKKACWEASTWCNERHMRWAWTSLVWVTFTDFYIRMCSMGVFTDLRIL
jgi:hypothetical protein